MLFFDPLFAFLLWFKNFGNMGHRHYSRKLYDFFTTQPLPILFCTGHHYSKKLYGDLEASLQRPIHSKARLLVVPVKTSATGSCTGKVVVWHSGKECFRVEVTSGMVFLTVSFWVHQKMNFCTWVLGWLMVYVPGD